MFDYPIIHESLRIFTGLFSLGILASAAVSLVTSDEKDVRVGSLAWGSIALIILATVATG